MLAKPEISEAMGRSELADRLIITPLLASSQIGTSSVDLRLGFSFLLAKRANVPAIDPMDGPALIVGERLLRKSQSVLVEKYICILESLSSARPSSIWGFLAISAAMSHRGLHGVELDSSSRPQQRWRPAFEV